MLERINASPHIEVSDFGLLKAATRAAVKAAGAIAVVAEETRLDSGTLCNSYQLHKTNFIPIDDAVRIDAMTGDCRIVRAMARLLGYRLVPINATDERRSALIAEAGDVAREAGELVSEIINVSADGQFTPTDARHVDGQAADLEPAVHSIRKICHGVMKGASR